MKTLLLTVALLSSLFAKEAWAQDSITPQGSQILVKYLNLKDAFIASNAKTASAAAGAFAEVVKAADKDLLNDGSRKSLLREAEAIARSKDLNVQREKFSSLSSGMYELIKAKKLSGDPVYLQYCPMKKASWLSNEKAIKNPYYGASMLTCGSLKETL